ncbi:hypothetical protein V6N13_072666 [Hibiscus sabdariffa]
MATVSSSSSSLTVLCFASFLSFLAVVNARIPGVYTTGAWESAHATFYGGSDASGTMATMAAGATLHAPILTSPCLCSSRSPSTVPVLSQSLSVEYRAESKGE